MTSARRSGRGPARGEAAALRVVLVRPGGPRNIGLALRSAVNFGPAELVVVAPGEPGFAETRDFLEMAHGVPRPDQAVRVVGDLAAALRDREWSVSFTARMRQHHVVRPFDDEAVSALRERLVVGSSLAVVFGSEVDGLSAAEAASTNELVRIPTAAPQRSINLGAAVAVVLSRLFRERRAPRQSRKNRPLDGGERERLRAHLKDVLVSRVRGDASRAALRDSIDRVFSRAPLESRDAQAWHKLLREIGARGERGGGRSGRPDHSGPTGRTEDGD